MKVRKFSTYFYTIHYAPFSFCTIRKKAATFKYENTKQISVGAYQDTRHGTKHMRPILISFWHRYSAQ